MKSFTEKQLIDLSADHINTLIAANDIWNHIKGKDIPDHWQHDDWVWIIKKYWHIMGAE